MACILLSHIKQMFQNLYFTQVIWRCWKISIRTESRGAPPGETKQFHDDFLNDSRMQGKYPGYVHC